MRAFSMKQLNEAAFSVMLTLTYVMLLEKQYMEIKLGS